MDAMEHNETTYISLAGKIRARRSAWTAEELAELLSISKKALYGMCRSGRIPHFRVGALIRFDSALIGDCLDSKAA
jgi:excisionase family DNA binding protein